MTRRETIVELARTLRDVQPAAIRGSNNHTGRAESISLEHSRIYRAGSYQALEQALQHMHSQRSQAAVNGHHLGRLHWHFTTRYLKSTHKTFPARTRGHKLEILYDGQWQPAKPNHGHREPMGGLYDDGKGNRRLKVEVWDQAVIGERVELALDWLEQAMPKRLWLPDWERLSERIAA